MATGIETQQLLFSLIRKQFSQSLSLVDAVAELLKISNDSAYRRLRCETLLNLEELIILCSHFKISLDALQVKDSVGFQYKALLPDDVSLPEYLNGMLTDLKAVSKAPERDITFTAEDCPLFHYFNYDLLTAFKLYYWTKSILNTPQYIGKKFHPGLVDPNLIKTAKEIHQIYTKIPSSEIWDEDTLRVVLKQIEFYWDSGLFEAKEHALAICDQLSEMLKSIQEDVEFGTKDREVKASYGNNFTFYKSEVTIGNNCILVNINNSRTVYFSFNTFNSLRTSNTAFCEDAELWIKNLISKSTQISGVSEKMRYQFFNSLHKQITKLRVKIDE